MITQAKYNEVSKRLGIPECTIRAVAAIESKGSGFLPDGQPVILFEPHVWWRQLKKHGLDPEKILKENPQLRKILYKTWKTYPYGKVSEQHVKLALAASIHRESALESASWGLFQIVGNNWQDLGLLGIQEFINLAYRSEDDHFELFVRFVVKNDLVKYLRKGDFKNFSLKYNGPSALSLNYPQRMESLYKQCVNNK